MKFPGTSFDYRSITDTIQRSLASAGLGREAGLMQGITDTIHRSLSAAGLVPHGRPPAPGGVTIDVTEPGFPGEFLDRWFANAAGARAYKLYVPASCAREGAEPAPLVVMLHGCKQTPGDFALGTRMNDLAERHGFLVAYPAQAANANGSNCWNWFLPEDQARDRGEPSILAGIVREIATRHRVDERKVFVAGMSAGGAMAVVLGATYPELFAGVGVHSGLPYGVAHDVPSAFGAMKSGGGARRDVPLAVPTIVFHSERDPTVNARNGASIVEQAAEPRAQQAELRAHTQAGDSAHGGAYRRTIYSDAAGNPRVEHWVLSGATHAWSGGDPRGSFTEARGPDASAEMIRFFFSLQGAGTA